MKINAQNNCNVKYAWQYLRIKIINALLAVLKFQTDLNTSDLQANTKCSKLRIQFCLARSTIAKHVRLSQSDFK